MSKIICLFILSMVIASDIYLIATGKNSISNVIYLTSKEWMILPVLIGIVIGHLFWPNKPICPNCGKQI
jgi:hypothetical protein